MKNLQAISVSVYFLCLIGSNLAVVKFGFWGLFISGFFLIPGDFITRCLLHETWNGWRLFYRLATIIVLSGFCTYFINKNSANIAIASCVAFILAQTAASMFYQFFKTAPNIVKVNGSDFFGIIADSLVFQILAFGCVDFFVLFLQILLKTMGGLMWYYIIFVHYEFKNK